MVLESLITPLGAEERPWQMFFLGILFSLVGIGFSVWVFEGQSSLVMVFLIVMACTPIVFNTMRLEERKDESEANEIYLLKEHAKALSLFMFLFAGIVFASAGVYVFTPEEDIESLFSVQTQAIMDVNSRVSGSVINPDALPLIFLNNLKVMIFCILFAFVYGVGSIFILVWNATVIGVALGDFIRSQLSNLTSVLGYVNVAHYFQIISLGVLRYATHGVFEILAYFIAGLAGGIISISVVRHNFGTPKFDRVLLDSAGLMIIALVTLFVAAVVEVYVTPLFFV
ncbi:MAG: stage II sporulation protein M [Nanoarchaeota archaeon]